MPIVKVELSMVIWVVEFSREGHKIKRIFGQKSISSKENHSILCIGIMWSCQKVPKSDIQSQFSTSKIIRIFIKKNFVEEYQSRGTFFVFTNFV